MGGAVPTLKRRKLRLGSEGAVPLPMSLHSWVKTQGFKPRSGFILLHPAAILDKHTVEISRMNQLIE